jgi:hypothetical protein
LICVKPFPCPRFLEGAEFQEQVLDIFRFTDATKALGGSVILPQNRRFELGNFSCSLGIATSKTFFGNTFYSRFGRA